MNFDILEQIKSFTNQLISYAEQYWQISIAGVVIVIGYIIYALVIK